MTNLLKVILYILSSQKEAMEFIVSSSVLRAFRMNSGSRMNFSSEIEYFMTP